MDSSGLLLDAGAPLLAQNPAARPLSSFDVPALVILGEAGSGKSHLLAAHAARLKEADRAAHLVDLGAYGSEARLERALFGASAWTSWREDHGGGFLHLLLDAFDEARLRSSTVSELLLEELRNAPVHRLRVTICCRPGLWSATLGERLAERFGTELLMVHLLGLTRGQIIAWAREAGADADALIEQVALRGLSGLASRPLTLALLLQAVASGGLPSSEWEIFEQGLTALCDEPDEDRRLDAATRPLLAPRGRIAVARRIAAAMLLAGRVAISQSLAPAPDVVGLVELAGGEEPDESGVAVQRISVGPKELADALNSGLMTAGRDTQELRFGHQSYAEHLAASWLAVHIPGERALDVLGEPEDAERHIVPQLRGVAARLAARDAAVRAHLLVHEPTLLLDAMSEAGPQEREQLTAALLDVAPTERLDLWDPAFHTRLKVLGHPGLPDGLRPVISDPSAPPRTRELAVEIARATRAAGLGDLLADVALGEHRADVLLRERAVRALGAIADRGLLDRLRPLALAPQDGDEDAELKGAALELLWPEQLTAEELFQLLTPAKARLVGTYRMFLHSGLLDRLDDEALPVAPRWAGEHADPFGDDALTELADRLLERGWKRRANPGVLEAFAEAVGEMLERHGQLSGGRLRILDDDEYRRSVLESLVSRVLRREVGLRTPQFCDPPLLIAGTDLPWTLGRLAAARGRPAAWVWSRWAHLAWQDHDPAQTEAIFDARDRSPLLRAVTEYRVAAWPLDTPAAQRARAVSSAAEASESVAETPIGLYDLLAEPLAQGEAGEPTAWSLLSWLVADVDQPRARHHRELREPVVGSPGWRLADDATRQRLVALAKAFLVETSPPAGNWLGDATIPREVLAGVRALELVADVAPDWVALDDPTLWTGWTPALIGLPSDSDPTEALRRRLRERAHAVAPQATRDAVLARADGEARRLGRMWTIGRFAWIWDAELEAALDERLRRGTLAPDAVADVLAVALQRGSALLEACAQDLVNLGLERSIDDAARAVAERAADALLRFAPDAGWSVLWPALRDQPGFGPAVVQASAGLHGPTLAGRISGSALSELILWLLQTYPPESDPPLEGTLGPRAVIAFWRGVLVRDLVAAGTPEAVHGIRRLIAQLGESPYLLRAQVEAQETMRRRRWRPPSPSEVIKLGLDASRRVVVSDLDLQRVLVEELRDIARALHSSPAVQDLWGTGKPKYEEECSSWLERRLTERLRGRGTIVNREVEVHRRGGPGLGDRTDLLVSALVSERVEDAPVVEVVIEVKGCWNADIRTAMQDQLSARYLGDEGRRCGVYLVMHFGPNGWSDCNDWRRRVCGHIDVDALGEELHRQAEALSIAEGRSIVALVIDGSQPVKP